MRSELDLTLAPPGEQVKLGLVGAEFGHFVADLAVLERLSDLPVAVLRRLDDAAVRRDGDPRIDARSVLVGRHDGRYAPKKSAGAVPRRTHFRGTSGTTSTRCVSSADVSGVVSCGSALNA